MVPGEMRICPRFSTGRIPRVALERSGCASQIPPWGDPKDLGVWGRCRSKGVRSVMIPGVSGHPRRDLGTQRWGKAEVGVQG